MRGEFRALDGTEVARIRRQRIVQPICAFFQRSRAGRFRD